MSVSVFPVFFLLSTAVIFCCMLMVCDMSSCCAISNLFMTEDTKSGSLPSRSLSLTDFASLMSQGIFQFHIDVGSEPGAWEPRAKTILQPWT